MKKGTIVLLSLMLLLFGAQAAAAEETVLFSSDFASGANGFKTFTEGSDFVAEGGALISPVDASVKALAEGVEGSDYVIEVDLKGNRMNSGIVFRVQDPGTGPDAMNGYFAGLDGAVGTVILGKMSQKWDGLVGEAVMVPDYDESKTFKLRVEAKGDHIKVYVNDMNTPLIDVHDSTFTEGTVGIRSHFARVSFDNFVVKGEAASGGTGAAAGGGASAGDGGAVSNPSTGDAGIAIYVVMAVLAGAAVLLLRLTRRTKAE